MVEEKEKDKKLKSEKYELVGTTLKRRGRFCPKCGAGVFLAEHEDRRACGKCGYMEKK